MKIDLEKLHKRFNKRWIGRLYGYSIFFILSAFGGILEFAFDLIYLWLWLVVIGYSIFLPISYIRATLKKHEKDDTLEEKVVKEFMREVN